MTQRKPIIGLCGGIGSGKTTVADEFARLGALVIDSDRVNHEVLRLPAVAERLREWWGDGVLDAAGLPDRERIAEIVFKDGAEKARLESLVHPLILDRQQVIISSAHDDPAVTAIILDSPLLLECNLDRSCTVVVFIEADESQRLDRVRRARGWDGAELRRREQTQLPLSQKRQRSHFVVRNEGSTEQLRSQIRDVLERILAGQTPGPH